MKNVLKCLIVFGVMISNSFAQTTYYINSSTGSNGNDGKTSSGAWFSLSANVNSIVSGDTVLFTSGQTFNESINFKSMHNGSASSFITLKTTGSGRATINGGNSFGIKVEDAGGFEINNLNIKGSGASSNSNSGINFVVNSNGTYSYIRILNCTIWNFGGSGLLMGVNGGNNDTRYEDVHIKNVKSRNNRIAGIQTYGKQAPNYAVRNFQVNNCETFRNYGDLNNTSTNTGNGIVLGSVRNGFIRNSKAYENGKFNRNTSGGPVGIWIYEARGVDISFNESFNNKAGLDKDGGGFDIDGGSIDCSMQYNYSYNNEGAGYLIAQYNGATEMKDLTIRYNISENDGRKNNYGGLTVFSTNSAGGIKGADFYNNTIIVSGQSNNNPSGVSILTGNLNDVNFFNNIITTQGGEDILNVNNSGTSQVAFLGNLYWSYGSPFNMKWGNGNYSDFATWQDETGQEELSNIVGVNANPNFATGFILGSNSTAINAGLDIDALYGIAMGVRDYYGNTAPRQGNYDIGAHESNFTGSCGPVSISNSGFDNGNLNDWKLLAGK